jgi:3'-phosphoadenosine 5'-phosphosulfate sulfotransferase (PAPS reductase)/FAD synthetase
MISTNPEIMNLIGKSAVFAIGVSGGKDSSIGALAVNEFLHDHGHEGPRVLIHSDLGSVEWKASINVCKELSRRLNLPLMIVERKAGGLMQRWVTRWENNVRRYVELSCVKLILPWSTPSMRFCTSELKTAIICRALVQKFRGQKIVNVTGIRREESSGRSKTPISKVNRLLHRQDGTSGIDWHPLAEMTATDVFLAHKAFNFPLHEAYTKYGSSRVSCAFCIMSKQADLHAAASCESNHEIYREMCELEIRSCFSFQSNIWLSDISPELLTGEQRTRLVRSKSVMQSRENIEADIPKHLLFTANWPEVIPTANEARLLCRIRESIGGLHNIYVQFAEPTLLIKRYEFLMAEKERRNGK